MKMRAVIDPGLEFAGLHCVCVYMCVFIHVFDIDALKDPVSVLQDKEREGCYAWVGWSRSARRVADQYLYAALSYYYYDYYIDAVDSCWAF